MILKKGATFIEFPERVEGYTVQAAVFSSGVQERVPNGYWLRLQILPMDGLLALSAEHANEVGIPLRCAIEHGGKRDILHIHPRNDIERSINIRYCPAMKEI